MFASVHDQSLQDWPASGCSDHGQMQANLAGFDHFLDLWGPYKVSTRLDTRAQAYSVQVGIQDQEEAGSMDKYKARLVANGYNQIEGIDYFDSFSPMAKNVIVRIVLALAVAKSWILHQMDINNAFLHGYLDEDIYMSLPEGYREEEQGKSHHDPCLFLYKADKVFLIIVYVADILITDISEQAMLEVKDYLHEQFTIKDLGVAKYFLEIEIARSQQEMYLTQKKYIRDILLDLKMEDAIAVGTPLPHDWFVHDDNSPLLADASVYRRLVGRLLYLNFTMPDLTFSVHFLSQFMRHPSDAHWRAALHVVKYHRWTSSHGLFYSSQQHLELEAYYDTDWAKCSVTRRSVTGYDIMLGSSLVSWKSKKQATVARSSSKA
ncbi:transmembrane signal receptor [Lithospermum erythrorhizon]|uniref:Transmembrane signal receptor n=1 Tax=Lithospermum erythrorhizon TaxID=34254 RepID=A0AAV3RG72_LITER